MSIMVTRETGQWTSDTLQLQVLLVLILTHSNRRKTQHANILLSILIYRDHISYSKIYICPYNISNMLFKGRLYILLEVLVGSICNIQPQDEGGKIL